MQKNELDSLPELVALGKIGKNQAAMKVLEILYTNPARFGLQTMDEDERSDFRNSRRCSNATTSG